MPNCGAGLAEPAGLANRPALVYDLSHPVTKGGPTVLALAAIRQPPLSSVKRHIISVSMMPGQMALMQIFEAA